MFIKHIHVSQGHMLAFLLQVAHVIEKRMRKLAARVIEKRMRKLVKLQEALTHWRTKISTNSREWEDRNRALRSEKEIMSRHYSHLKSNMDNFRCRRLDWYYMAEIARYRHMNMLLTVEVKSRCKQARGRPDKIPWTSGFLMENHDR
eukprot:1157788-Pelagomonas_calceolata.AAC.8